MKRWFPLLCLFSFWVQLTAQTLIQTEADSYTRYELLSPASQSFRIIYDVSATTPGARYYFNTLRKGSQHTVDEVRDLYSGEPLRWRVVDGLEAREYGYMAAAEDTDYLMVELARPVPVNGEARVRIDKTYMDPISYFSREGQLYFERTLGIARNSVVLPKGYELVSCNYPVQVQMEADGRIKVSFMNTGASAVPLKLAARPLPAGTDTDNPPRTAVRREQVSVPTPDPTQARLGWSFSERAFQDREIVYFLQQPETHAFRLYHDYTETREGMDRYLNVVRAGSRVENPSAYVLDTGEKLKVETLRGKALAEMGIDLGEAADSETEVVVIWFDPVKKGASTRLRIEETYVDPNRYLLHEGELIWDRAFGRNRNTVILPDGWFLVDNLEPAVIDLSSDGRVRLQFVNPGSGSLETWIRARRR